MTNALERIVLVSLVAGMPMMASAQTTTTTDETTTTIDEMVPTTEEKAAEGNVVDETATETTVETVAAQPVEGQIVLQSDDSILANDLIGLTVYSPTNEEIGDINDIIVKLDGAVEGVVIGVGGFLGIGEKNVAVKMNEIGFEAEDGKAVNLVLNATADDLEAAPAFKTALEQKLERESEVYQQQLQELQDSQQKPRTDAPDAATTKSGS